MKLGILALCFCFSGNAFSAIIVPTPCETVLTPLINEETAALYSETPADGLPFIFLGAASDENNALIYELRFKKWWCMTHDVLPYGQLDQSIYYPQSFTGDAPLQEIKDTLEAALSKNVNREKFIIFSLTGIDLELVNTYAKSFDHFFTSSELLMVLENPELFYRTRWFDNGTELTVNQAHHSFRQHFPEKFN